MDDGSLGMASPNAVQCGRRWSTKSVIRRVELLISFLVFQLDLLTRFISTIKSPRRG